MSLFFSVRAPELDRIEGALAAGGGVLTVAADSPQEAVSLMRIAAAMLDDSWAVATVDMTRCGSSRDLAIQFARAAAATSLPNAVALDLPEEQLAAVHKAALIELANVSGERLIDAARGSIPNGGAGQTLVVIGDALDVMTRRAANGEPTLLVVEGADELLELPRKTRQRFGDLRELLWLMRGRLQNATISPSLVFAGGPATIDLVTDPDGGFFGWGTELVVTTPPFDSFLEAVMTYLRNRAPELMPPDQRVGEIAESVVRMASGSISLAERLLTVLDADRDWSADVTVERAWAKLVLLEEDALRQTARAISALDRLALPVALALANERAPYQIPEARFGSEVAKALASLRIAGFVVAYKKGAWRLTDPLLASWLRQPKAKGHMPLPATDVKPSRQST